MTEMEKKLIIVLLNSSPKDISALSAAIFQATVAAAMDVDVELIFTGSSRILAKQGVADQIHLKEGADRNLHDHIKEAVDAGVVIKVCTPTMELWAGEIIPEIQESVGSAYLIKEALEDDAVVLTY